MTDDRPRFWDPAKRAAYLDEVAEKADVSQRRKDGESTAEELDRIWAILQEPEKALILALLAAGQRSFVAAHDHPDLRNLVVMGLLAYPRGQGGSWMRAAKTTYSVPSAVWKTLQQRHHGAAGRDTRDELTTPGAAEALLARMAKGA